MKILIRWSFLVVLALLLFVPSEKISIAQTKINYPDISIKFDFSKNQRRYKKALGEKVSQKYLTKRN
jgi:hypothetical protein